MPKFRMSDIGTIEKAPTSPASLRNKLSDMILSSVSTRAKVELVKGGFEGLEGPVATPDGGLYLSDIITSRTYRLDKDGNISVWRENTKGINGQFLMKDGRLLGTEGTGLRIVAVTPDKRVTPLAT